MWMRLLSLCCLCLYGCGYHFEGSQETLTSSSLGISIPYVMGDQEGKLTDALIKQVSLSGFFHYQADAHLQLQASILQDQNEQIGYQYDRDPIKGSLIKRLIPNEGRRELVVEISLIDLRENQTLLGPLKVKGSSDYDFVNSDSIRDTSFIDPSGKRESVLFFSLGQLDSFEGASASAATPLYQKLSQKIVQGLEVACLNRNEKE